MSYIIEKHQADVVIVGGGLAGCTAALQAREEGASVIVLEAANTYRSGNAGSGVDHVFSYVPPVHEKVGYTKEDMKKDMVMFSNLSKGLGFPELGHLFVDKSYERIIGLEKYGINFDFGDDHLVNGYRLVPQWQSIPTSFNFEGRDIKVRLTEAMKAAGVEIINRAEVVRILTSEDGKAAGAVAVSTVEEKIIVVTAKATIICTTAGAGRLSENSNTTYSHWEHPSHAGCGAGVSLPMRAGAEVTNLEFAIHDGSIAFEGFNFTVGAPGGSWWPAGRLVDEYGNVIVERTIEYDIDEPDYVEKNRAIYAKYNKQKETMMKMMKEGRQLFVDFSEATDEEIEQIRHALFHEGRMWLWLQNLDREGIDLKSIQIPYKYVHKVKIDSLETGVLVDVHCESTLPNLYAAGDSMGAVGCGFAPGAIVYGYEAGLQAATKVKDIKEFPVWADSQAEEIRKQAENIRTNEQGSFWKDVQGQLQGIINLYGSAPITDNKVENALDAIKEIRKKTVFSAKNAHEVSRCFEIYLLLDAAEAIFTAAKLREESFAGYIREHNGEIKETEKRELYGLYYDVTGKIQHKVHASGISK